MIPFDWSGPEPLLHVVLHAPEIPQNAGNIGRTCVAVGARLWMIRPLGFQLDEKSLRRAGLDYWQHLDYRVVDTWGEVQAEVKPRQVWCIECPAERTIWQARFEPGDVLLFGNESSGLPQELLARFRGQTIGLPMRPQVRSLNLASTANTVVYEALRQIAGP